MINNSFILEFLEREYGLSGQISFLVGELDLNYLLVSPKGKKFLIKVAHEGEEQSILEMQNQAFSHLQKQDKLKLGWPIIAQKGSTINWIELEGKTRLIRVLEWVEGRLWSSWNPISDQLLQQVGRQLGLLSSGLDNFEHPSAKRWLKWDPANLEWIAEHFDLFNAEEREQIENQFQAWTDRVKPNLSTLRKSVIYGDANDNNIVLTSEPENPKVESFLDFGDMVESQTIHELAIALAYLMMNQSDPIWAACEVIRNYHAEFPLEEKELDLLYHLIIARLLISITASRINAREYPENEYLQISDQAAWNLFLILDQINPSWATYCFRWACGFSPHPQEDQFKKWCSDTHFCDPVSADLSRKDAYIFDFSIGSLSLGQQANFTDDRQFENWSDQVLKTHQTDLGIGKYAEYRPFYTSDDYIIQGPKGLAWRTMHLGLDVFLPAQFPVLAVYSGIVKSVHLNPGDRNYGPTIIVEHQFDSDKKWWSLYGHLSLESLESVKVGEEVQQGQVIGRIGPRPENGNWPPHLHFQVMLDLLDFKGDFPGVAPPHYETVWKSISPFPGICCSYAHSDWMAKNNPPDKILEKRKKLLGGNLSISYREPLSIVRGYGAYLYDKQGQKYLDTVNNVAHIGHQHPRLIESAKNQVNVLNTNTRYLHDNIIDYAEALLATFPDPLSKVYFVNSGSEANELAIRMSRIASRKNNIIGVESGYHGNTNACIDISPYKHQAKGGFGPPNWYKALPIPDSFRGIYRGSGAEIGEKYASHLETEIQSFASQGQGTAAFIIESILSCGGQIDLPEGYLKNCFSIARKHGALCIVDEVQVGFGRVGQPFWGFSLHGVVPDIVTLGKPIGNGHPMGAVVCTAAVAEAFHNGMEFFSTFGGNPVSCAIGKTVLDVIHEEGLVEKSEQLGAYFKEGLIELQNVFPIIGDVRGQGLFLGFELNHPEEQMRPLASKASYLSNRMRETGILTSTDGPDHNVIKIKPPLAIQRSDIDRYLNNLNTILKENPLRY